MTLKKVQNKILIAKKKLLKHNKNFKQLQLQMMKQKFPIKNWS